LTKRQRILITGAAGKIGDVLRKGLRGSYPLIRVADIASLGAVEAGEEIYTTDIRDIAALEKAMAGIDCVVHSAARHQLDLDLTPDFYEIVGWKFE
jgi:uronate dehydrogenase